MSIPAVSAGSQHLAVSAASQKPYTGPAKLAADNDGDGRKGAAALNDGDAAARIANKAIGKSGTSSSGSVSVKA
jgi:hypothetical protein